jgi:nitrous oxidase accessory protein
VRIEYGSRKHSGNKYGSIIVFLAAIFLFLIIIPGTTLADTITVKANGGDYSTIQQAVDRAKDGDMILVSPGNYKENLDVNRSLTIRSESGKAEDTVIEANISRKHVFYVAADFVQISGFTVIGASSVGRAGVYLDRVQGCNVTGNVFSENELGILLEDSHGNTLENNNASNNMLSGIVLKNSGSNTLSGNSALNNELFGIVLAGSDNNDLENNTALGNGIFGIVLKESGNNTLGSNTASGNGVFGILLDSSNNSLLNYNIANSQDGGLLLGLSHDNEMKYNTFSKNHAGGIVLEFSSNNTLSNNIVTLTDVSGIHLVGSSNNVLSNNTASSNYLGISLEAGSSNNVLSGNILSGNEEAILEEDSSGNELLDNEIKGEGILGIPSISMITVLVIIGITSMFLRRKRE